MRAVAPFWCVADLSPLSSFCEVLDVEGSTAVFCEGQPTQGLFLLVEGCVQVEASVDIHKHINRSDFVPT